MTTPSASSFRFRLAPRLLQGLALTVLLCAVAAPLAAAPGWTPLFDGKGLDHWTLRQPGGWKVEDGLLAPTDIRKDNYLWTKGNYSDFELELEFKMSPGCNSGVFFRSDPENPVQGGFEIQIFDSHGKAQMDAHDCGALYDAMVPRVNAARPAGEWNTLRLVCQGPNVTVVLNGKTVTDANLDQWTEPNKNPDGSKNKFKTALKDLPRTGRVGLQYHGHPIWFRNVRIRPQS
jgi:hypothetical protein